MKDVNELNTEIEMIKRDISDIKNNHLTHIESDLKDVKVEVLPASPGTTLLNGSSSTITTSSSSYGVR